MEPQLVDEMDALLDALWNAAVAGDTEAAIFLQMFAPWATGQWDRTEEKIVTVFDRT